MVKRREKFTTEREPSTHIQPLTDRQAHYLRALDTHSQVVVLGPAGTGKTYLAGTRAADGLRTRKFSKLIITRPNVPGGRSLGFFPGTLEDKIGPWVVPLVSVIQDRMGHAAYEIALKRGDIEIVPFEVMRGRTFQNAFIILDEAQNTTPEEIKMFLTRIGEDSKVIINGDVSQTDLKVTSGLAKVISMISKHDLDVPVIEFSLDDIVRSDICAQWVRAFHKEKV